jgi:hypothetical protein
MVERDIFDTPVDHKEAKEAAKSLGLPAGSYRTEPVLAVRGWTNDDGRRMVSFFGAISLGGEVKGKIGFRCSPDLREKENANGELKPDWHYQKYLDCLRAFKETTGQDAVKATEIVDFIANYPVVLRVTQSEDDGSNFVTKISKARD